MAEIRVNPTRMELKKIKARYNTSRRGHKLLKDKRDELMRRFLEVVRENKRLRETVESKLANVQGSFALASAVSSPQKMTEALMLPKNKIVLTAEEKNVMSVMVPQFDFTINTGTSGGVCYGYFDTPPELDSAVKELEDILPDLIMLAQQEKTAQLLADEIEKTRRRVNALEYIMIPNLLSKIKEITMKLEENERGNTTRLMKVKDMMVASQHNYSDDDE